mmetsp:Transcript_20130/g.36428  ORF Transcript_20130/g.36428 Transcript_20130/m.36428 type:complete len:128 (+) Transcript_20130:63-446(+)
MANPCFRARCWLLLAVVLLTSGFLSKAWCGWRPVPLQALRPRVVASAAGVKEVELVDPSDDETTEELMLVRLARKKHWWSELAAQFLEELLFPRQIRPLVWLRSLALTALVAFLAYKFVVRRVIRCG